MEVTRELARFVARTTFADLPLEAVERSKLCFLDWLGVTLGGATHPLADILVGVVKGLGGKAQATVIAKGFKAPVAFSALINGAMAHALDFDDTHEPSLTHPNCTILPAAVALAEERHLSGKDLLTAFILAFEVEARIGLRLGGPSLLERGWHPTGVWGRFGAACAAAKLLGLGEEALAQALGIAGSQASGFAEVFGTMSKPLTAGKAAMDGVLSALLAQRGFTSSLRILEGERGLAAMLSAPAGLAGITGDLGKSYEVTRDSFKTYASGLVTQGTIDALRILRGKHRILPQAVEAVLCEVHPMVPKVVDRPQPRAGLEGKFSLQYCAALALAFGQAGLEHFSDEGVKDPALLGLAARVRIKENAELSVSGARVTVRMKDGAEYVEKVAAARGTAANPMTYAEMEEKFRGLASLVLPRERMDRVVGLTQRLEEIEDIGPLMALCR